MTVAGGLTSGSGLNQLCIPVDMFVDSNDAIYIADVCNHRIIKWDKDASQGYIVAGSNEKGNQIDQLHYVTAMFVDSKENIYVSDNYNHRIQKWSKNSKNGETIIGKSGRGNSLNQISNCWGLYVDKKFNVYVSEHSANRVTKWSPGAETGKIIAKVGKPIDIYVDESNDDLYVASYQEDSILHFNTDGILIHKIGNGVLKHPYGFAIMPGSDPTNPTVIIADSEQQRIVKMNMNDPKTITIIAGSINTPGKDPNEFNEPRRVRFDSKGNLLVLDSNNNRVQKLLIKNNNCNIYY
ncbi:unnamed protein product [Adineta steineri]|uniref:NHL repeat containing protein n=2 Tax=Adineta steineri TaxID=433720 RepID=A0A813MV33_9BILA|nr:unnamed protein product [Adineta steineri]